MYQKGSLSVLLSRWLPTKVRGGDAKRWSSFRVWLCCAVFVTRLGRQVPGRPAAPSTPRTRYFADSLLTSVAELLAAFGSKVAALTVAVSLMLTLPGTVTFTANVMLEVTFGARPPSVQLTFPVPPTGGALQLQAPGAMLTKFVPVGIASFSKI